MLNAKEILEENLIVLDNAKGKPAQVGYDLSIKSITKLTGNGKILKDKYSIECYVITKSTGATGLEMEALTTLSISRLTIYDMCKGIDKGMEIKNISLIKKTGGKSGIWKK